MSMFSWQSQSPPQLATAERKPDERRESLLAQGIKKLKDDLRKSPEYGALIEAIKADNREKTIELIGVIGFDNNEVTELRRNIAQARNLANSVDGYEALIEETGKLKAVVDGIEDELLRATNDAAKAPIQLRLAEAYRRYNSKKVGFSQAQGGVRRWGELEKMGLT